MLLRLLIITIISIIMGIIIVTSIIVIIIITIIISTIIIIIITIIVIIIISIDLLRDLLLGCGADYHPQDTEQPSTTAQRGVSMRWEVYGVTTRSRRIHAILG